MCATCGCDSETKVSIHKIEQPTSLKLDNVQFKPVENRTIELSNGKKQINLEQDILQKNNQQANHNRNYFIQKNILALNLVSSPGSGKTSLLERTLLDIRKEGKVFVIEGDQQTSNDANRIAATGVPVVQINTGKGCHLDSEMIWRAVQQLKPTEDSVLFIENIGNLVCPAMFDLGERKRVVIISVTEGEDKPQKYPDMFETSQLCIINKIDLLPYLKFDVEKVKEHARKINPKMEFIELSCSSGEGLEEWYQWIENEIIQHAPITA
jgi:hydrogenase nickel incorporation protein HypB